MREAAFVGAFGLLLFLVAAAVVLPADEVLLVGQTGMLGAAAVGVPLEVVYFALLAVVLGRRRALPHGWYWRTFDHHHLLLPAERWLVLPFFYLGALSFLLIVLGIAVCLTGVLAALVQL